MSEQPEKLNAIHQKLKELGFENSEVEPKACNRFIVSMEDIPAHLIKAVHLPSFDGTNKWENKEIKLTLYNPVEMHLEDLAIKTVSKPKQVITVSILTPTGDIDMKWELSGGPGTANFGIFDWSEAHQPNLISLTLPIIDVKLIYTK